MNAVAEIGNRKSSLETLATRRLPGTSTRTIRRTAPVRGFCQTPPASRASKHPCAPRVHAPSNRRRSRGRNREAPERSPTRGRRTRTPQPGIPGKVPTPSLRRRGRASGCLCTRSSPPRIARSGARRRRCGRVYSRACSRTPRSSRVPRARGPELGPLLQPHPRTPHPSRVRARARPPSARAPQAARRVTRAARASDSIPERHPHFPDRGRPRSFPSRGPGSPPRRRAREAAGHSSPCASSPRPTRSTPRTAGRSSRSSCSTPRL